MIYIKNNAVLPNCPYCGARLGYLESFTVKNRSLYKCKSCKNKSSVDLKHAFYYVLWIVQIVSVVIFVFSTIIGGGFALFGLWLILMDFAVFYGISPYMVELKKPKKKIVKSNKKVQSARHSEKVDLKVSKKQEIEKNPENENVSDRDIFSS